MRFLSKRISVMALSGYLAKESALFEDFIDTFQVHCECSHAQLLETLDPVRNYVDMPVLFEWWQHVIRPSQVYSRALLQSAVGLFEEFHTTVRAHNISLGAVPDGLLSFQSDQGLSLKTVMTIFASSDCLAEQVENLDFVPAPQDLNAVKKRGHGFVLSELKNPIPLSPTHCKTSDHVRALMMSKLTAYKKDPNMPLEIKILRHFFALMDKTSDGNAALTDCEKMDLAQIVLAIPIAEWQEAILSKLVLWTKEFKSNLGTSLTNALLTPASFRRHPNHGLLCDLFQTLIDSYPELSFESEIQGYARQSSARRRETPVTLADLYATVQQKKSDLLQKQAAEVSLETLIQRFSGIDAPEVDVPIAPAQLADIYQQVVELNQYCTQYARRPVHEIVPQLHTLSQGTETRNSMIEILAGIRLVMKDQFKQYAYDSQIMVVLGLLQHPDDFRGRLAQVKTGEGKSMIITMLSSYLGLRGKYVDVVTSADSLAIRDVEKYRAYYTLLGLSCGHVCERPYQASHFLPQILYGTVPDFSWAILYDHVSNTKYRLHPETQVARPFDCVIVDEVDNMLIDQIENRPIIGGTSRKQKDLKWIFIQITDFYLENKALYAQKREAFEAACIETLHTYASATGQRLDVPEFVLKLWCYLAHSAQSIKQEGRDYIIQKKLNPEVKGGIESKVTIVDWEHTGKIMENNVYTSGLNSFLEYKHRLPIKQRYCSLAELPQAVFFDFYTRILGVTGTMGSHAERKGLQEIYQLDSFDAPTYRSCLRETYAHHVCTTELLFFETLADLAESVSKTQRPVLVLLMAISETNKLAKLLSMRGQDHQLYNGIQEQSETFVIAKAGHPRMITVSTNTAGRGTDIILSRMSRAQGGLHVILGFFPANSRVEAQAFGRSSRQGQPGSWQFVICEEIEKERTRLFQDAPPASDMSSTDYFQTLYALREKSLLQEAKKRAISAKIQKEMFGYMHRFFAINTQIQHLNTKNTITLVGSFLSHCRYQKPDNAALSPLEKAASEQFLQLSPLTRDKTDGWLSSFLNEFSITILEDWASFFGNIHMLVEYLHSMTEDIDFLTLFQTIEVESHRFFSVYQNSGNPLFFMGELLAKMGIRYNPEETKNKDWPPLLDALYQQNESLVTVLKGNGETYDSGIHKKGFSYLHGFLNIQDVATCKSLLQESNVKRMDMAYLEQNNDLTGVKPAHLAIKMGHLKIIQKMHLLGFDFQSIWNKKSGLYLAVNHGHTAVVAYLLREKIGILDQYDSSLKLALTQSKHDIVRALLLFRHPKNMPELVRFCYENQFTDSMRCLLEACTTQEKKKIRKLSVVGYTHSKMKPGFILEWVSSSATHKESTMLSSASSRLSSYVSSKTPSSSIADEMAKPNPGDFIVEHTEDLIKLDTIKRNLEVMETQFKTLPEGQKKEAVAEAIRKIHTALADAIIAKLKEQAATSSRSRSSSAASAASDDSPKSQSQRLGQQMTQTHQNLYFFTQSTLGRFIVAKVLQELESDSKLPASLYMTDMVGAQPGDFFAASAALYPKGLFAAASKDPNTDLSQKQKIALLEKFDKSAETQGKLPTSPIDQAGTWLPFVDSNTTKLLEGDTLDNLPPQLEVEMKKDLSNQIKENATNTSWIDKLRSEKIGSPQWQTQFQGFEKELCDGLCLALAQTSETPDTALLQLTMSVAEHVAAQIDDPKTYTNVIAKLSDSNLGRLIGPDADPGVQAMVAASPKWRAAIGARLEGMDQEVQKSNLHAVLNVEVKLPKEAEGWVPPSQRQHVGTGYEKLERLRLRDFKISPRMMLPHLIAHPIAKGHAQEPFCKNVDLFCRNPTDEKANIDDLYSKALDLEKTKQPLEVQVRIDLIKGIVANIEASKQNTTVADLGSRTWPTKVKPPLTDPKSFRTESSYSIALKAFQKEEEGIATPKTLLQWVNFLKHDGAAKVEKYKEQNETSLSNDSHEFKTAMEEIAKALEKKDIPAARKLLQDGIATVGRAVDTAITKRIQVRKEMAQVYRRLDKAIVAMLDADKTAEIENPEASSIATKPTVTPLTHLTPISPEITQALMPTLRAYDAGIHATTPSEIDTQIALLESEHTKSNTRVKVEEQKTEKLKDTVAKLTTKGTDLQDLLATIRAIEVGQEGNDDALAALGAAPNATTGTAGSGLYGQLHEANTNLEMATDRLGTLNDAANVPGSIFHATAIRAAKQLELDTAKALVSAQNIKISKLQAEIAQHEATIDANATLLGTQTTARDKQKLIEGAVTQKEKAIQDEITKRVENLTTYAKAQRNALERDTVLGRPNGKANETLGDALAKLIKIVPKNKKYTELQTQLQKGLLGNALATIGSINSEDFKQLKESLGTEIPKHSALGAKVEKKIAMLRPTWATSSTQTKALIAAGPVTTLEDRIKLAVNYGDFRTAKASTAPTKAAVKFYTDAIKGDAIKGDGTLPPLETLLMNETPGAAIKQLDDVIGEIRTLKILYEEEGTDQEAIKVCTKLIAELNDLKSNIDQATRKTAAGRSDKMGEVARLRHALILLSDDPLSAESTSTTPVLTQNSFHAISTKGEQTSTVSLSAKAKLEKMGLIHTPETPWTSSKVSTEMCTLFLATIQSTPPAGLFETITEDKDSFSTFRDRLATDTEIPNKSLQALALRAQKVEPEAITELNSIFKQLKKTYTELNKSNEGTTKLTGLKAHADSISAYLKKVEAGTAQDTDITDTNEQALLRTLGILVPETPKAIDDAAAKSSHRLYEHRPLTMGLLTDVQAAAPHAASEPNVIRCMRTAFSQATGLSVTKKSDKESDKELMKALCENSEAWSLALLQQPWDQDQSPKAAVTNADRLTHTISAYTQACALRDRLSVEVDKQKQHGLNLQNISDTLDHLLLDIQRGVVHTNTEGSAAVLALSLHDTPEKQLNAVGKIRIEKPSQSASVPPSGSQQRLTFSEKTQPELPLELTKRTQLSEFPPEFALTVGEQKQHVTRFYPDGNPKSKKAALATLFGTASSITAEGGLLRSVHDDRAIDTQLEAITDATKITDDMKTRFVACLTATALPQETQKQILGVADLPIDTTQATVDNINRYLDFVKKEDTAAIYPHDLLFLSELYERPLCLFTHHSLGDEKLTMERTCVGSKQKPIHIAVSEGHYERWEIRSETSAAAPQRYSTDSSAYAASPQTKRFPIRVLSPSATLVRTTNNFGTAFSGNTGITCWLEAFIYSTAYERDGATLTLLKSNSDKLKNPQEGSGLATWQSANPALADAVMKLSEFLTSVRDEPTATKDITALDQTLQRVFFGEAWRQQDAMQFREMLMGTLSEMMKAESGDLPTLFSMPRESKIVGPGPGPGTAVPTTENRFMGHEAVEFRINLHHESAALTTDPDLSAYLVHQDEAGTVADYELQDGTKATITKGERVFVGEAPGTCQIQVMSAVNDYTHASPAAHTLTPTRADTDAPSITLPIKASDADADAVETRYLIEQVVVRSGAGTEGGHYECYFKKDANWYLKTSNGSPATRIKKTDGSDGGFSDIHEKLTKGGYTYTYMGVKVP